MSLDSLASQHSGHLFRELFVTREPCDCTPAPAVELVEAATWDRLAVGFTDVNQEQTWGFSAARWGSGRVECAVIREGGELLGGAVVIVVAIPGTSRAISWVKWGPLWRRAGQPLDAARLRKVLLALKQEYAIRRGHYFSIHPFADPDHPNLAPQILRQVGFVASWSLPDPDRYLVNVALAPDALRRGLGQKWRYNLKKAEAQELKIAIVRGDDGLPQFMNLYRRMLARKGFLDSSAIATLPALMASPVETLRPHLVLASHDGEPTAGAVIDVSGDRAVYLFGATDERALGLKAGYALQWWIVERLCRNPQIRWYDLGGKDFDQGLHQFKKGLVGRHGAIIATPPSFEFATSFYTRSIGHTAIALRRATARLHHAMHRTSAMLG